jgi:hypothetical protein
MKKLFIESSDSGGSKLQSFTENDLLPIHPLIQLLIGGIRTNKTLQTLDITGSCRFGLIDPSKSCDPDDRELEGAVKKRPRLSIERTSSYTKILINRFKRVLNENNALKTIYLSELELDNETIDAFKYIYTTKDKKYSNNGSKKRRIDNKGTPGTTKWW